MIACTTPPSRLLKTGTKAALEAHFRSLSLTLTHSRSLSLSLSLLLSSSHSRTRTLFLVLTVLSFSLLRQLDQLNVFFVSAARSVESDNTVVVSYAAAFHCIALHARMLCYATLRYATLRYAMHVSLHLQVFYDTDLRRATDITPPMDSEWRPHGGATTTTTAVPQQQQ